MALEIPLHTDTTTSSIRILYVIQHLLLKESKATLLQKNALEEWKRLGMPESIQ